MIKLKDLLLEARAPKIFIPRRTDDRVERMLKQYIRDGSEGYLDLSEMDLIELPEILKNISVGGGFSCMTNILKSLKNSPKEVDGNFDCLFNKLISLQGAPTNISGDFDCRYNRLTSLDGAPKIVSGDFYCSNNRVQFTEEQVIAVCDVKGNIIV